MLKIAIRSAAALALGLGVAACASGGAAANDGLSMQPAPGMGATVVHVENHNWSDMDVFVVQPGGMEARIGMVTSMTSANLKVPATLVGPEGDLQLMVHLIGSSKTYLTQHIMVSPGQRVRFRVENNLALSNYDVR